MINMIRKKRKQEMKNFREFMEEFIVDINHYYTTFELICKLYEILKIALVNGSNLRLDDLVNELEKAILYFCKNTVKYNYHCEIIEMMFINKESIFEDIKEIFI